jgi:hypothetical protein
MLIEQIFQYCTWLALLGWIILILALFFRLPHKIVTWSIIPILLSVVYAYLIIVFFGDAEGGFDSLEELSLLFQNKHALLAGWIHYLAFDLWLGYWQLRDSKEKGVNRWFLLPCFFFTLMYGPVGLLLYLIIRSISTKKLVHENF